jgi:hypothetical protein
MYLVLAVMPLVLIFFKLMAKYKFGIFYWKDFGGWGFARKKFIHL